jgi:hypothetical protein
MLKIPFEFTTQYGTFKDTLNLPDGMDYTDEQIEGMKQQRLTNWLAVIEAPQPETP